MSRGEIERSGIIDFAAKRTAKELHPKRVEKRAERRDTPRPPRPEASLPEEQQVDTEDRKVLHDQLRFLLKRLDISEETLRDPRAVETLSKSYKKILNEQKKAVTKYDTAIAPLQTTIRRDETQLSLLQKHHADSKGLAKLLPQIFPILDMTGKEISVLQARLETSRHTLETQQGGRAKAESAGSQYNEFADALQRAVSTLHELDRLPQIASQGVEVSRKKVVILKGS